MVLRFCILLYSIFATISKNNETFRISGIVIDSKDNPIDYAYIQVFEKGFTKPLYAVHTDSFGNFILNVFQGSYDIEISHLGFYTIRTSKKIKESLFFGQLMMIEKSELLDDIVILGKVIKKTQHTARGTIIDISNDSFLQNITALETIALLPKVRIGENNQILLNDVPALILINGKQQRMSNKIILEKLEGKSGSDLTSVELIDVPSSKYSSSVGAIININIIKQKKNGMIGRIGASWENVDSKLRSNLNVDYKIDNLIFSTWNTMSKGKVVKNFDINSLNVNQGFNSLEKRKVSTSDFGNSHQFGIDYTISSKHSISGYANLGKGGINAIEESITENKINFSLIESLENLMMNQETEKYVTADLSYRYDVDSTGQKIDFSFFLKRNNDIYDFNNETILTQLFPQEITNINNLNNREKNNTLFSSRLDYVIPIKKLNGEFEIGARINSVILKDKNVFSFLNAENNQFEIDSQYSSNFQYSETNYIGYFSFSVNNRRLKYSCGARGEFIKIQSKDLGDQITLNKDFDNLLLNLSLKYLLNSNGSSNINFSFRQGYSLPAYRQLNPFTEFVSSTRINKGNADLTQSEYGILAMRISLLNKHYFSFSLNNYNNIIEQIFTFDSGVTTLTFGNFGIRRLYTFNYSTDFSLISNWRMNLNVSSRYTRVIRKSSANNIMGGRISTSHIYKITKDFKFTMNLDYLINTESDGIQNTNFPTKFYWNLGATKSFDSNAFQISFQVKDLLGVYNNQMSDYFVNETSVTQSTNFQNPKIRLSLVYILKNGQIVHKKSKVEAGFGSSRIN